MPTKSWSNDDPVYDQQAILLTLPGCHRNPFKDALLKVERIMA